MTDNEERDRLYTAELSMSTQAILARRRRWIAVNLALSILAFVGLSGLSETVSIVALAAAAFVFSMRALEAAFEWQEIRRAARLAIPADRRYDARPRIRL